MARTSITVLCIRHGESTFNAAAAGSTIDPLHYDAPLSEVGHQQVERTRKALRYVAIDLVITTPLTRALQTAAGLFADHPSSPTILVESLHRERVEPGAALHCSRRTFRRLHSIICRKCGGTTMTAPTSEACASSLSSWFSPEPKHSSTSCCNGRSETSP